MIAIDKYCTINNNSIVLLKYFCWLYFICKKVCTFVNVILISYLCFIDGDVELELALLVGQVFNIVITHVENSSKFYIQLLPSQANVLLQEIEALQEDPKVCIIVYCILYMKLPLHYSLYRFIVPLFIIAESTQFIFSRVWTYWFLQVF